MVVLQRQGPFIEFLESIEKAMAVRTLESLGRIELAAQGGALLERVKTTRTSSSCPITSRLRRRTRWWVCMTSCVWHA